MTSTAALLTDLLDYLRAEWPRLFPGQRPPQRLGHVLQGTGVGKLIVFILAPGERWPRCLVKIPRAQRDNAELAHEHGLVMALRARGGALAAASLPEPLDATQRQGWQIVVERVLPGHLFSQDVPAGRRFTLGRARAHLQRMRAWYVGLQRAVHPCADVLTRADIRELFENPIRQAQRQAELRPHEQRYLDELARAAQDLAGRPVRLGFVHGDLRPGNILTHGSQLRVIDWQFGQLRGPPMLDWFEFTFRYYCEAHGLEEITGSHDDYRAAFANVFLDAHPYSALARDETVQVARGLGVPERHLDLLLAMWLVDNTNKYIEFLSARARHGYLYLMQNPPGGPFRSFRQQLRRQVYPCLLGQLAQSRGALARTSPHQLRQIRYSLG